MKKSTQATGYLLLLPLFLGLALFFVVPFCIVIYYSLTSGMGGQTFVGLQNYLSVTSSGLFQLAAWNTARFLAVSLPLIMVVSLLLALLIQRLMKGSQLFRLIFMFPMIVPIASVLLFLDFFFAEQGMLNTVLSAMGLPVSDWLHSDSAFLILVYLFVWKNCGYNIILILAGLYMIPMDYYESAKLDGVSAFASFRYITLPMIQPTLLFTLVISIIQSFKSFREAFLIGGNYPHDSIYLLQHFINNNFENVNYARLSVAAVLIFAFVLLLALLFGAIGHIGGKRGDPCD